MDSFATCYHRLNPGTFEDKDKAHLGFSVMLNSDHYNDAIKKSNKMKFDDFVRNHRGMGISEDLLRSVWKDITGKEIQLASRVTIESNFRRQMLNSARRSLALLSGHASMCRIYASKMSTELATLMLEVGWPHFYACIPASRGLADLMAALVLEILRFTISACLFLGMETERRAFATPLKFTFCTGK